MKDMHKIYESYIDFCNEGNKDEKVLYKFTFGDTWLNQDDKPHGPVWVLANSKEWSIIKKQAAIVLSSGYGAKKSEQDALDTMKYQKEHKDDTTAGGNLTSPADVIKIIKGLHKVKKVKESFEENSSLNEGFGDEFDTSEMSRTELKKFLSYLDNNDIDYNMDGDIVEFDITELDRSGQNYIKSLYNKGLILQEAELSESKVAEAIMDLLEKWYKKPGNKNILKKIMDLSGIDDVKVLTDVLDKNVDAYAAFNSMMALESVEINEKLKFLTKKQWEKLSSDEREEKLGSAVDDPDDAEKYAKYKWDDLPDWVTSSMYESIEEGKTEYVKVNFGDKKETESALDYIQSYGQNYASHPKFGITRKSNGDVWFEVLNMKQRQNLDTLIRKNGGTIIK